jgi:hypothetical protein
LPMIDPVIDASLKKDIEGGQIGKVFHMEAEYLHQIRDLLYDKDTGAVRWRMNRPPLHYCSHSLGPLLMLLKDDHIVRATGSPPPAGIL